MALRIYREKQCSNFDAWRMALEKTQRPALKAKSQNLTSDALRAVLVRFRRVCLMIAFPKFKKTICWAKVA